MKTANRKVSSRISSRLATSRLATGLATMIVAAAATFAATALVMPADSWAQQQRQSGTRGAGGEEQQTRQVPAMREVVVVPLTEAQECIDNEDLACARRLLQRVRDMSDLNSFEEATMWQYLAHLYAHEENYVEAIRAFENVLEHEDIPLGLEVGAINALWQFYYQEERYEDSLAMFDRWVLYVENPPADSFAFRATILYQLRRFREGIPEVYRAIEIAREQGEELRERWYQLLQVFYFELEDFPSLIDTLQVMVELWPKREYVVALAGFYGQEGDELRQLAMFETAYEAGWLTRSTDIVTLANMHMQAGTPFKAARVLEKGLEEEVVESTLQNWRLLAQAWQGAHDHEAALPALRQAADLSTDGNLDVELARSYQSLARWQECADTAREGLRKGDLRREDQAQSMLGMCLAEMQQFDAAERALVAAQRDERSRAYAQSMLRYVRAERDRLQAIEDALAALQ